MINEFLDRFTYYTIIGKDVELLLGHINNIKRHAGFDELPCEKEFIVIVYTNDSIPKEVTEAMVELCKKHNIITHIYEEPKHHSWLENLYACWNLGYEKAKDGFVFRAGSDQAFNKNSFTVLYDIARRIKQQNSKVFFNAQTIEHSIRAMTNNTSRHLLGNFGDNYKNFDILAFEDFCKKINNGVDKDILTINECLKIWGKPTGFFSTIGHTNRTEGCSWLMTKQEWLDYGPMPVLEKGITGDCVMQDRLIINGYKDYLVRDCVTYHFFRGECGTQFGLKEIKDL